ncbi:MAG: ABC transporter substrate-binding protein [Xanthobacteraceae bacterium]
MRRREFISFVGSAATAWPLAGHAQQSAGMKRIAVVHPIVSPETMNEKSETPFYLGLFTELRRLGYVEGTNLIVERRSGEGKTERYADAARELVFLKPDVMVVTSSRILAYFREATTTIPIIAITGDPILFGIVSNVSRPEGNITGFSADASVEIHGKYLELLKEIKPSLSKVGLVSPGLSWEPYGRPLRETSSKLGVSILGPALDHPFGEPEFRDVIAAMASGGADALLVTAAAENFPQRRLIIDLAEKYRMPAIYPFADYVKQGGLAAYAVDIRENGTRAAGYVHKILQGAKVADLPYYMPTRVQLFLNLKTAKALGLEIPPMLLARADEVIE